MADSQGLLTVAHSGDLKELKQLPCFCCPVFLAACPCLFVAPCGGLCGWESCWVSQMFFFLSVSFFSQMCSLAASAGLVLGDSLSKSNQLCTRGAASKERT